jgi:hypothetical protein
MTIEQIVNMALHRLGTERISSIDDSNKRAVLMKDLFPIVTNELLEAGFWNFAMTRKQLVKSPTAPTFGWASAFALPFDFNRLYKISSEGNKGGYGHLPEYFPATTHNPDFVIEGEFLLTDLETVYCVYAKKDVEVTKYTSGFIKAAYLKLAAEGAYSLTQDRNLSESLTQEAQVWLNEIRSRDSMNDNDPDDQPEFESLVLPRF